MINFISFMAILTVSLATYFAGFVWWVPVVGTLVLCATSSVWSYVPQLRAAGILRGALPIYLQSVAHAALAIGASCVLGQAMRMVSGNF